MAADDLFDQARLLIARLERISVDSVWARRSSGLRGALLKWVEGADQDAPHLSEKEAQELQKLLLLGFDFIEKAAREKFPRTLH
ncbi:MAG: hypothetical protein M5U05_03315 [Anaerolineales bacterium]|jgi:hypothetical protein|nr:hypothetical protein [Anaerolineales bacterium]